MIQSSEKRSDLDRNAINLIRKRRFRTFLLLAFIFPAIWLFIMVLFYEGIGLWVPEQNGVVLSMGFFYISMVLFYLAIAMFYKENYDSYVTFTSLSLLFWFSAFIVFPFRYEVDTLKLYTNSIVHGMMISTIFSSIGIFGFLFLYRYRVKYEEKKSLFLIVISSVLGVLSLVVSIVYYVLYGSKLYITGLIAIPVLYSFILVVALLTISGVLYSKDRRITIAEYLMFALLLLLTIAMFVLGILFGDYISHRSFFLGGLFSLFLILSYIPLIIAFKESEKWNRLLFFNEANSDNAEYSYIKGY